MRLCGYRIGLKSFIHLTGGILLIRSTLAAVAVTAVTLSTAMSASAERIVGLTTQNSLTIFDSETPGIADDGGFVSGVAGVLLAIDYRPATMELYGLSSANSLYTIDLETLNADLVGSFSPRLNGTSFAFDFNPAFMDGEFARIISETDRNRVISGDTGQYLPPVEKTPVFYADGDPNDGTNPNIAGIAYTNNVADSDSTMQFGIDASLGILTTVANNAGTLNTVGSLGLDSTPTNELGFDISGATEIAYASIQIGPNSGLYTIDLGTGDATFQGIITSGDIIRDITVVPIPEPTTALIAGLGSLFLLRRRRSA